MKRVGTTRLWTCFAGLLVTIALVVAALPACPVFAVTNPQSGSIGLEGTISSPPPKTGATISSPSGGAVFGTVPITVSGLCPKGLLVKLFSNNVFVGSVDCANGSYSIPVDLFSGQNELVARVYDALDQAGPDSNTVTVTFNDPQFVLYGSHVALSSIYARRGANPGEELTWPIILSGGVGPYAISIDWGDGSPVTLISQANAGNIDIKHTYKSAGVYKIIVKATDKNGTSAYLQLVGVANGKVGQSSTGSSKSGDNVIEKEVIWWPALVMLPLIILAYWLGRRSELYSLRKALDKQRSS